MAQRQRGIDTREAILTAMADLVLDKPYAFIQKSEILAHAGVTNGGLYAHFTSKEDIAAQLMEVEFDLALRDVTERVADLLPSIELLVAAVFESSQYLLARPRLHAAIVLQAEVGRTLSDPTKDTRRWHGFLTDLVDKASVIGDIKPGLDSARLATYILSAWTGTRMISDITTGQDDLIGRIEDLLRFVIAAAVTPDRVEYFDTYLTRYANRFRIVGTTA